MALRKKTTRKYTSPYLFYGVLVAVPVVGIAVTLVVFGAGLLLSLLVAVNLVTLGAYGLDKAVAGTKRTRIPELVLHALALFGGTPAAFAGQQLFKHKRKKGAFLFWFWGTVVVQVVAILFWVRHC